MCNRLSCYALSTMFLVAACAGPRASRSTLPSSNKSETKPSVTPILTDEDYAAARPEYDGLALDLPERAARRGQLTAYLLKQVDDARTRGHLEDAYANFRQALTLYDTSELDRVVNDESLRTVAESLERAFARRGSYEQVLVALVVQQTLTRSPEPRSRYDQLAAWLLDNEQPGEINGRAHLVDSLEAAATVWPSPLVVEQLTELYLSASPGASASQGRRPRSLSDLREMLRGGSGQSAYALARLYLRVSRPKDALMHLNTLKSRGLDDAELRERIEKLLAKEATATDVLGIAMVLTRDGRDDRDVAERVCDDGARRFPKAAEPLLCSGQLALSRERHVVALHRFEQTIALEPARREAWESLARLYQVRLIQLVANEDLDVRALERELSRVEKFHADAAKRFTEKPIHPSMAAALFEVGRGYLNAGRPSEALRYLDRSLALEPSTSALELIAQIHLKHGQGPKAIEALDRAGLIKQSDQGEELYWRARLGRYRGDAIELSGDTSRAEAARKQTLSDWDSLLGLGLTPEGVAESSVERAKIQYQLGEREDALASLAKAIDVAPDRASTYADAISFLVQRGELDDALDAYHRALGRNEVTEYIKVYCSLWIMDLAARAGAPDDPLAKAFLASTDGAKWYADLARWASGRQSEDVVARRADTPGRRAEFAFYRAMRAHNAGRAQEAESLWKQVLDTEMMAFFEYDMAAFYLKRKGAPSRPVVTPRTAPTRKAAPPPTRKPSGSI